MIHSKYITDLGDKTEIPLRTIEAEWKVAERQLNDDVMMEPSVYTHLKKKNGSFYEEVARRVEKALLKPEEATAEEKEVVPGEEPVPEESAPTEAPIENLPVDEVPETTESEEFALPAKEEKKTEKTVDFSKI